ncbi:hypothetical protein HKK55_17045 [Pseudomonas sp. ADAK18]|uniref:hypothetical protein n=1 Tax=Pseudomonas sp. ADAK18 TaxID=2730848 RepID=UPI0014642768|nr:hypothetical protein [Pseudomonas sp. ADAK18]QJI30336.1 hypothetical protein HKK55_17045 [Pseudomonas sp. ADAK18]
MSWPDTYDLHTDPAAGWWNPTIEPYSILQAADLEKLTKDRLEHLGYWPTAVYQSKQQRNNAHSILKILKHT